MTINPDGRISSADAARVSEVLIEPANFLPSVTSVKFLILISALLIVLALSLTLVTSKKESAAVRVNVKDFREHGVSLIGASDPSFADLSAKLTKSKSDSISELYSVFLKNTGSRAVVGYRIKWECVDGSGEIFERDVSNITAWIFLHGEESDHRSALGRAQEIIRPNSIWLIRSNGTARPVGAEVDEASFDATESGEDGEADTTAACRSVTVIADGIFFDDGTFIGPDTTNFFTEVKTQMDARHEILNEVQNDLKAGKKVDEIFRGLETIRDRRVELGASPSPDEFRAYFRRLFAQDILGMRELWGADKAMENVRLQLSRPWVKLRKL